METNSGRFINKAYNHTVDLWNKGISTLLNGKSVTEFSKLLNDNPRAKLVVIALVVVLLAKVVFTPVAYLLKITSNSSQKKEDEASKLAEKLKVFISCIENKDFIYSDKIDISVLEINTPALKDMITALNLYAKTKNLNEKFKPQNSDALLILDDLTDVRETFKEILRPLNGATVFFETVIKLDILEVLDTQKELKVLIEAILNDEKNLNRSDHAVNLE